MIQILSKDMLEIQARIYIEPDALGFDTIGICHLCHRRFSVLQISAAVLMITGNPVQHTGLRKPCSQVVKKHPKKMLGV